MKEAKAFSVVECEGTHYEIGRQYGVACRESIQKSLQMNFAGLVNGYQTSKEKVFKQAYRFLPLAQGFDPHVIEFVGGEAEGAGISFEEAFLIRCSVELGLYFTKISSLCTSFAATGTATRNGKTILGQNVDWFTGFPVDLLKIKHADGPEQLALAFGGVAEYVLSAAGLGMCANLTLAPAESYRLNLPYGCYLPKAMRQKTIGDALGVLCQAARGVGYYHLASAEGDIVGIESTFDDFNIIYPENDILVHSNHYLTERFKKGDWAYMAYLSDSYIRVNRIKTLMERRHGDIIPETMMEILADHDNHPRSICRHADPEKPPQFESETLVSFIMVPEDRTMYVAYGNPCRYEFFKDPEKRNTRARYWLSSHIYKL